MAEVGLLPFARIALQVAKAVLPRYRSRFSKHQFTQHQLLAILCLMRYEDWAFREAEVRLGEYRELRQALGLSVYCHEIAGLLQGVGDPFSLRRSGKFILALSAGVNSLSEPRYKIQAQLICVRVD